MSKETVTVVLNEENALPFLRTALGAMRSGEAALICQHLEGGLPKLCETAEYCLLRGRLARFKERFKESRKWLRKALDDPKFGYEARYELQRSLLEGGRRDMAADVLVRLLKEDDLKIPLRVHANSALAVAYTSLERYESAQKAIEEAAAPGIISAQLLADEAYRLAALGARQEALQQLQQAVDIDAGCPDAFFLFANLLHIHGQAEDALQVLAMGLEQVPTSIRLLQLAGEVYRELGNHADAAEAYRAAIAVSPEGAHSDGLRLEAAKALFADGKTGGAKQALEELLERNPRSSFRREARSRLAALASKARGHHRIKGFPRTLQKRAYCAPNTLANLLTFWGSDSTQDEVAAQIFTDGARWHDLLSFLRSIEGFETRAFLSNLDEVKSLLDSNIPVIVGEYTGLDGHCIALLGYDDRMGVVIAQDPLFYAPVEIPYADFETSWDFTDSLVVVTLPTKEAVNVFAKLNPTTCEIVQRWTRALSLRQASHHEMALGELENLMASHPEFLSPFRTATEIHLMRGAPEKALEVLRPLLKANKKNYWALRYAGEASLSQGDLAEAWEYFGKAVRRFADDSTLHYARAEIAFVAGDRKRARAELMWALDARPAFLPARLRLAQDYLEAGDLERAQWQAEHVLEIAPGHLMAEKILDAALDGNR
ncbi:MAG: C39 family peptidase [Planctomycetes bacterium]|nr:C39 family peptidase [Planctomycetota bacterium]